MNIGRKTVYGNPFGSFGRKPGETLPFFRAYIEAMLQSDRDAARAQMKTAESCGFWVSWDQFNDYTPEGNALRDAILDLDENTMYCPGCRANTNSETCHGSVLLKIKRELEGTR